MKRTRRWEFVKQDAIRLAGMGLSNAEIARRLEVDQATVGRWRKAGKLGDPPASQAGQFTVSRDTTPAQWAAAVRDAYDLDVSDNQIVSLAESALLVARDPAASPTLRLSAMREFRAAVHQLALVARQRAGEQPEPPKRETFRVPQRSSVDPRASLKMVN